jgi:lipoprotein-releasing system permease protein
VVSAPAEGWIPPGTPVAIAICGVGLLAALVGGILASAGVDLWPYVALVGGVVALVGLITFVFVFAAHHSVDWLLAWRYIRVTERRWHWALTVGLGLILVGGAALASVTIVLEQQEAAGIRQLLQGVAYGVVALGAIFLQFGTLLSIGFSAFTSISIFGVYLSTSLMVCVLSIMGGFKDKIRSQILGTRAHVIVTRPKQSFDDYDLTAKKVLAVDQVVAASPYLEGEVMITSQSNLDGVLLRGIDPHHIGGVNDLPKYLEGKRGVYYLTHPEALAKLPVGNIAAGDHEVEPKDRRVRDVGSSDSRPALDAGSGARASDGSPTVEAGHGQPPAPGKPSRSAFIARLGDPERKIPEVERPVRPGLWVGRELAKNLRLAVGDDVNLVAPLGGMSPAGPIPKARPFRVAGVFFSGNYEYDAKHVYATMAEAQIFLGFDDEVTGIEVKVTDAEQAAVVARRIGLALGPKFQVRDWLDLNQSLLSALKLEKVVMFFVLIVIIVVASLSIITNLVMVVLEKTRGIATFKAMGANPFSVRKVFVCSGLYIGVIGMSIGLLQGVGVCSFLSAVGWPLKHDVWYFSTLPVQMNPLDIAVVCLSAVTLSFLATIYPAWLANRIEVVAGLRA